MKFLQAYVLIFLLSLFTIGSKAQFDPSTVCRVENGKIIFKLDLRWNDKQKKEIESLFNLDSLLMVKVYSGSAEIDYQGIIWKVKKIKPFVIELSLPVDASKSDKEKNKQDKIKSKTLIEKEKNKNAVFLLDDNWIKASSASERESAAYGVNNFSHASVFQYRNGIAQFYLPGYKNTKKVYLAGSFNNWNTSQTPMQSCDSGWIIQMKLLPGKYTYKYITDGNWMQDPNNKHQENDGFGNINSYLFCYNYRFELKGHFNARKVIVAGTFNQWNKNELRMNKDQNGWDLPLYLNNGTHAYKFLVDNDWITDPENKYTRNDGTGNINSILEIGKVHQFILKGFTNAKKVILAGSFNGWNSGELLMNKVQNGWQLSYTLAPGNYEYKFIIDGKWMIDPDNNYNTGSGNFENSFLAFEPNFTFTLKGYPEAKNVILSGNFNNWNTNGYRMIRKDNQWIFPIYLKPGKWIYKFIVDGKWILDPDNKVWEGNEYGTNNSVLWKTP